MRHSATAASSLQAGTMTVTEGLPVGERSYSGRLRLGTLGRPRAAVMAFQAQPAATIQDVIWAVSLMVVSRLGRRSGTSVGCPLRAVGLGGGWLGKWWSIPRAEEEDPGGEDEGDEGGAEADAEVGAVADGADDGWGDGVSEGVDEEELAGEGGGADLGADGVDGCGVDGAGAEEDEEDGEAERGEGEGSGAEELGAEEADDRGWDGEEGSDGGDEVERFRRVARPELGDGAAEDGSTEAGEDGDCAHEEARGAEGSAVDAMEERGHPPGDAAEREGDRGVSEDGGEIGRIVEEREDGLLLCAGFGEFGLGEFCRGAFGLGAFGFLHDRGDEEGDEDSGDGGDDEAPSPAEVLGDGAADEIAERRADRDGDVEEGEDAIAAGGGVEVGEHGGGEDAEGGLADAEGGVAEVEGGEGVDGCGEEVDAAPEEGGDDDHGFAGEAVAEPAGDRRGGHVGDHEPEGERADLGVGEVELAFDLLLNSGEDVAIDVVDEVEGGEEDEGGGGSGVEVGLLSGRHDRV